MVMMILKLYNLLVCYDDGEKRLNDHKCMAAILRQNTQPTLAEMEEEGITEPIILEDYLNLLNIKTYITKLPIITPEILNHEH